MDSLNQSPEDRKLALFYRQKDLLDTFLATGAIDKRQYDRSLSCLREKMGIDEIERKRNARQ